MLCTPDHASVTNSIAAPLGRRFNMNAHINRHQTNCKIQSWKSCRMKSQKSLMNNCYPNQSGHALIHFALNNCGDWSLLDLARS